MAEPVKSKRKEVILINALVLPGLGHVYVKKIAVGASLAFLFSIFAIAAVIRFVFLLYHYARIAGPEQLFTILVTDGTLRSSVIAAAAVWAAALADSFRVTRKK